jgi:hypothetical protein
MPPAAHNLAWLSSVGIMWFLDAEVTALDIMQMDTFEAVKVNVYTLIGELAVRLRGPQVGLHSYPEDHILRPSLMSACR